MKSICFSACEKEANMFTANERNKISEERIKGFKRAEKRSLK